MGKREAAADNKRSKRHKRHHKTEKHHHQKRKTPPADTETPNPADEEDVDVEEQLCEEDDQLQMEEHALAMKYEEEIVCDGEVELPQVADNEIDEVDGGSIDVGAAEEEYEMLEAINTSLPGTPTPSPNKSSKAGGSTASKKSSASKLSITPTIVSPKASTSAAAAAGVVLVPTTNSANVKKSKRRRDSGTSSDEERWLTAIESGKLEDVDDELKKIKDPKLMTARQRAMYERNAQFPDTAIGSELLMSLPTGYREKEKPQTAEDIQKAALKSQKRKELADAKREKDKRRTMDRLLKKQESKQRSSTRGKGAKAALPMISYRNSSTTGVCIQMPPGVKFPLSAQQARTPPKVQLCGIAGCGQPKVYNCSKTNLPLCSFACYRKNVQAVRQIMC